MTQAVLLGDVCTQITDGAHWSPASTDEGHPMASVKDMLDYGLNLDSCRRISTEDYKKLVKAGCRPEKNDVLIAKDGSYLKQMFVTDGADDVVLLSSIAILKPNTGLIDPRYLVYYIRNQRDNCDLSQYVSGAAIPRIILKNFARMPIELPSLAIQKKIADILSSLDEKIELNRKMHETLEKMGQALFRYYFIDNPEASKWKGGKLEDVFDVTMGQSPPGSSYNTVGEGVVFYQGRAEFGIRFPAQRLSTTDPKRLAKRGDTLLSVRAPVGDINQATEDCCVGRGLAAISSSDGFESYCYYLMKYMQPRFADFNAEGTVFGAINGKQLKEMKITISPHEERQKFNDIAKLLDEQIWINAEQTQTLITLRDILLLRLISGKLRV